VQALRLVSAITVMGACFDPRPSMGGACTAEGLCPDGLECVNDVCVRGVGGVDASALADASGLADANATTDVAEPDGSNPVAAISTLVAASSSGANLASYTFATQPIGAPAIDRLLVVAIGCLVDGGVCTVTGVTIQGTTAMVAVENSFGGGTAALFYARVPSGTTADVTVTTSSANERMGIALYAITGQQADTPTFTDTTRQTDGGSTTVDVQANGTVIALLYNNEPNPAAWQGLLEDLDVRIETDHMTTASLDSPIAEVGRVVTVSTDSNGTIPMVVAAWR
jgi:hypothetical protein